jgi:hypothetical protein
MPMTRDHLRVVPWVAAVFAVHLAILVRFWFDTPVLDDLDCILDSMASMENAGGIGDWLKHVFALQNEHRLAGTRLMPLVLVSATGTVDFRVLMLAGSLFMFGVLGLMWAEFRDETTGPIAAAAAFLLLQWSYNEALLMASAATAHLGVVFFSFAALYFALRPGWASALACGILSVLAAYSQANGLFVLPLAGFACLLLGRRRRGVVFLAVSAAVWLMYFTGYARPPNHPSLLKALEDPVKTFQQFLIIIGGIVPVLGLAQLGGAILLAALGWVTWKGLWRRHPTVYLWIVFVLVSAAAVAAARVGFGLHYGSRYAVNAALLMALLVFSIHSLTGPWRAGRDIAAVAVAAVIWAAILAGALPAMRERSFRGHLLVEVEPGSKAPGLERFTGAQHPNLLHAARILDMAERHGWYYPRRFRAELPTVALVEVPLVALPIAGFVDQVMPFGSTVMLRGWTDIAASVPGRKFTIFPSMGIREVKVEALLPREDVAVALRRPDLLLSGFKFLARFDSEEEARKAAAGLCVYVEAPGHPVSQLQRDGVACK